MKNVHRMGPGEETIGSYGPIKFPYFDTAIVPMAMMVSAAPSSVV